jgi:hypothetical protein
VKPALKRRIFIQSERFFRSPHCEASELDNPDFRRGAPVYVEIRSSEPSKITEIAMERLHFICPITDQDIDVGIDSELETLLRIRSNRVLARCPVCGERHEWQVREARLLQAA